MIKCILVYGENASSCPHLQAPKKIEKIKNSTVCSKINLKNHQLKKNNLTT